MSGTEKYHVVRKLISEDERLQLLAKADGHFSRGERRANPAGPHRFGTKIQDPPFFDELVEQLLRRVRDAFGLVGHVEEPVLNKMISRIEPGGCVHPHMDNIQTLQRNARARGRVLEEVDPGLLATGENFRCNVMIQCDNESAHPIIDGEIVEVAQCDAWGFMASQWKHGTQLISGAPRIIYGFGFVVPPDFEIAPN